MIPISYGLRLPNGNLLDIDTNRDLDSYYLTENSGILFLVDSKKKLEKVLFEDPHWSNSSNENPCWGKFKREQLIPVTVETKVEDIDLQVPRNIQAIDCRSIIWNAIRLYTDRPLKSGSCDFVLVNESLQEMKKLENQVVHFGSWYTKKRLVYALEVPEEYVEICEEYVDDQIKKQKFTSKDCCLLICELDENI